MQIPSDTLSTVTRRCHGVAFKRKLVAPANRPGASVAAIALEHGVNANLLFKWRTNNVMRSRPLPALQSRQHYQQRQHHPINQVAELLPWALAAELKPQWTQGAQVLQAA